MSELYDNIGANYATGRGTDPNIAAQLHCALDGATSVLNIGAGTGSYEPAHLPVTAVEPSAAMIGQRGPDAAPVVRAHAENLPFEDNSFSHCMTVLSMHHWRDREQAFREIHRVTRQRLIVVTWDPEAAPFWVTRDYFPGVIAIDREIFPPLAEFYQAFDDVAVSVLPIPADCVDGFFGAYWRRPHAYLDPAVRTNMSTFARISGVEEGVYRLRQDLESGRWERRNRDLLAADALDIGYRIVSVDLTESAGN